MGNTKHNEDTYIRHVSKMITEREAEWIATWVRATGADKHQYVKAALIKFTAELQEEQNKRIRRIQWLDARSAFTRQVILFTASTYNHVKSALKKSKGS